MKENESRTPRESSYLRPSADGAEKAQRLIDEGMKPEFVGTEVLRGRANRRVAYVARGSQKAVQPL
jgi:hypothetical protein